MAEELPSMFAERYELGEIIGRGGMAEVHIAHDTRLGRTVAIKALRTDLLSDPTFQARFRREAQSAASLNHPSIVSVYDSGEETFTSDDGTAQHIPFIVMEYVEGHTVRDLVRDGAALPIDEAIEITVGVLNALEYSHHSGIVHRDIKPANVMLTPTGAIKVMDFGIARVLTDPASTMTQTHAVVGTAQYLSPEQAKGESVDARSDLYSTGVLLYELLTGRPPFKGESAVAVAYQHVGEQAPVPSSIAPDLPEALDRITMKALAKDRDERYASAAAFRSDLEAAAQSGVVSAPAVALPVAATQVMGGQPPFPGTGATAALPQDTNQFAPMEDFPEEVDQPRSKAWLWVLLVALLVGGGILAYVLLTAEPPEEEPVEVAVPQLSQGMSEEEVTRILTDAELTWDIQDPKPDRDIDEGTLLEWDPDSGVTVDVGTPIALTFSDGPEDLTMPDILGYKKEDAKRILIDAGFDPAKFVMDTEHAANTKKDIVTRTTPDEGTTVSPSDKITIYTATGDVEIPEIVGMELNEGIDELPDGISYSTDPIETDDYPPGTILSQDRQGIQPIDTRIHIEYAVEMPEVPEPEEEPTEEPDPPGDNGDSGGDQGGDGGGGDGQGNGGDGGDGGGGDGGGGDGGDQGGDGGGSDGQGGGG